MKQLLRSLQSFTRAECTGIVALVVTITILLLVRIYLNYLPPHTTPMAANEQLNKAYQQFAESQPIADTIEQEYTDRNTQGMPPLPYRININTADSATLVRLKGLGPAFVHKILAERKNQPFTRVDELREIQAIPPATWAAIKPHLSVNDSATQPK